MPSIDLAQQIPNHHIRFPCRTGFSLTCAVPGAGISGVGSWSIFRCRGFISDLSVIRSLSGSLLVGHGDAVVIVHAAEILAGAAE